MNSSLPSKLGAAVVALLFLYFVARFLGAGLEAIDDAYISMRYARNLIHGHGLVYNAGEYVQGYTNFLWTMMLTAVMWAGLAPVPAAAALGGLAGLGTVLATWWWAANRVAPGSPAAAVAPVLLVVNMGFVVWCIRGLETGLFTLLITAGGLLYLRRGPAAPLSAAGTMMLALASLTRPEGGLAFALTLLHLLGSRARRRLRLLGLADLPALGLMVTIVGAYAAWATFYYGSPLPNTFHAKVGDVMTSLPRGWEYLLKFIRPRPELFWPHGTGLVLLVLPACLLGRDRQDGTRSYAAVMVAGYGAYIAAVGGDVFPAYRFLVPIMPFLYLLAADGVAALEDRGRRGAKEIPGRQVSALGTCLLLTVLALATIHPSRALAWREWNRGNEFTRSMRMVGEWLRQHEAPGTWIAVNPSGALPYEADLPTIDMLGLNDREIARTPVGMLGAGRLAGHEKGNGASVFRRLPEIILIGGVKLDPPGSLTDWRPHGRSERELAAISALLEVYRLEVHPMPDGRLLSLLRRRAP